MVNLIKVIKTENGKVNCYVVDTLADRNNLEDEAIGALVFVIEDGQYYKKMSSGGWFKIYTGNERVPKNKGSIIINVDKEMTFGMPIAVLDPDENDIFCRLDRYDPTGHRIVLKDVPLGKYKDLKLMVLKDDKKYFGKIITPFEVTAEEVLEFDMILEPEDLPDYSGEIEIEVDKELENCAVMASFNPPIEATCRVRNDEIFKTIVIDNIPLQEYKSCKITAYRDDSKFKGFIKTPFKVEDNIINKLKMTLEEEVTPVPKEGGMATIEVDQDLTGGTVDVFFNPPIKNTVFTICKNEITVENIPNGKYESIKILATKGTTKYSGFYKQPFEINNNDVKLSVSLEPEAIPVPPKNCGIVTLHVDQDISGGSAEVSFNPPISGNITTIRSGDIVIENVPAGDYKSIKVLATKGTTKYSGFSKEPFTINGNNIDLSVSLEPEAIPVPPKDGGMITLHVDKDISRGAAEVTFNPPIDNYITTVRSGDIVIENVPEGKYKSLKIVAIKDGNKYSGFYKQPFDIKNNSLNLDISLEEEKIPVPPLEGGMVTIKVNKDITGGVADVTFNPPVNGAICTVRKGDMVVENVPNGTYYSAKIVALKGDKKYTGFCKKRFVVNNNSVEISASLEEEKIPMPPKNGGMVTIKVNKDMTGGVMAATFNPNIGGATCTINKNIITIENIPEGKYGSIKLLGLRGNSKFTGFCTKPFTIKNNNVELEVDIKEEVFPEPPVDGGIVTINVDKNMVGGVVAATFNPNIGGAICTVNDDKVIIENVPSGTYSSVKLFGLRGNSKFTGFCKDQFVIKNNNIILDMDIEEEILPTPPKNGGMLTVQVDKDLTGGMVAYSLNPNIAGTICTIHKNDVTIENIPAGDYQSFKIIVTKGEKRYTGFYKDGFKIDKGNTNIAILLEEEVIITPEPNTTGIAIVHVGQDISGSIAAAIFDPPVNGASFTVKKDEVIIENIPNDNYNSVSLFVFNGDKQYSGNYNGSFTINNNEVDLNVDLEEGVGPGPGPGPILHGYEFDEYSAQLYDYDDHKGYEFDNRLKVTSSTNFRLRDQDQIKDPSGRVLDTGSIEVFYKYRDFSPLLTYTSNNPMHVEFGFSLVEGKEAEGTISYGNTSTSTNSYSKNDITIMSEDVPAGKEKITFDVSGHAKIWFIRIIESGSGDGLVRVNSADDKPGYLIDKLVGAKGSGISFSIDKSKQAVVANFNQKDYEGKVLETMAITSALCNTNFSYGTGYMAGTVLFPDKIMTIKKGITKAHLCNMAGSLNTFRISLYKYNQKTTNLDLVAYTPKQKITGEAKVELAMEYVNPKLARVTPDGIYYLFVHKSEMDNNWGSLLGVNGWGTPVLTAGNLRLTLKDTPVIGDQETCGEKPSMTIHNNKFNEDNQSAAYIYFRLENPE